MSSFEWYGNKHIPEQHVIYSIFMCSVEKIVAVQYIHLSTAYAIRLTTKDENSPV
jgi:hypothetical protein